VRENYSLSEPARRDLNGILRYGIATWGELQADSYYSALLDHLNKLSENPKRYPVVTEIRPACRKSVFRSHAIYFEVWDGTTVVLGIIRSQDPYRLK